MRQQGIDPKSAAGQFLGNMAASKSLEAELKEDKDFAKDKDLKSSLNEDKKEAGLKGYSDNDKMGKLSAMQSLVDKYKTSSVEEMRNDPAYQLLPKYAKQGAENLVHLEKSEGKKELKDKYRNTILSRVIEGKEQSKHVSHGVKQRTLSKDALAKAASSKGKE